MDDPYPNPIDALTEREREILACIARGLSNQEIADQLFISLKTVKWYNTQIFEKLGVKNRREAVQRAEALGLLHPHLPQPATSMTAFPAETTPFVGRERELNEIAKLLVNSSTPLVTILGIGGMGKTRLAIKAAERSRPHFSDGVYLVPLAALQAADRLVPTIAEHIHLPIQADVTDPRHKLLEYLQNRKLLLVLDNFEHLLDGAALLSEILDTAPGIKLLVTSRERLNLRGESIFALTGMPYADSPFDESALDSDAVRLFLQSARRLRPDFTLHDGDLQHVLDICDFVEGMPLAVELAAGWSDVLTLEEIASTLCQNIDLLQTELRDIPERHRSIRATFYYSWARLTPQEQDAFMRLSVFRGGLTKEAAQAVASTDLLTLRKLVNKALLHVNTGGRYSLHELLRQYAEELLTQSGAAEAARERHAQYYADLLEQQWQPLRGFDAAAARAARIIEADFDNVVAAWLHLIEQRQFDLLERAANSLWRFTGSYGRIHEGIDLFNKAVDAINGETASTAHRLLAAHLEARVADLYLSVDTAKGQQLADDALKILQECGPSEYLLMASKTLGYAYHKGIDPVLAEQSLTEAYQVALQLGNELEIAEVTQLLGLLKLEYGHHEAAAHYGREALNIAQRIGDSSVLFQAQILLGLSHQGLGDLETAYRYLETIAPTAEAGENLYAVSIIHTGMSQIQLALGNITAAKTHTAAIIHYHLQYGHVWQTLGALYSASENLLIPLGDTERAVEVLALVSHHPLTAANARQESLRILTQLQAAVPAAAYETAYRCGRDASLNTLIQSLLHELES